MAQQRVEGGTDLSLRNHRFRCVWDRVKSEIPWGWSTGRLRTSRKARLRNEVATRREVLAGTSEKNLPLVAIKLSGSP